LINVSEASPRTAFSDLISGPSTGLNDGKGEGAIITLWGYDYGETTGAVFITDSTGKKKDAAYIYYWKKADGTLPGGPSNLYKTHKLYEIAFSLPNLSNGPAGIVVESGTGEQSSAYPFTIRDGNIYHVTALGSNSKGDGSFGNPWEYINGWSSSSKAPGNMGLKAGDIVYSHGVHEPSFSGGGQDSGMFLRGLNGSLDKQIAIVSYPNTHALVESERWGVHPYLSSGIVVSKFTVKGGLLKDPNDNSPTFGARGTSDSTLQIKTSENGRIVGNFITDSEGKCSNGWSGAISGGGLGVSNTKVFGNYIFDIGCRQTSHFHHTTYMSKREDDSNAPSEAWEFGWNYLSNNKAKFGIHFYDESPFSIKNCGDVIGTLKVHHNYIENQRGTGINIRTRDYDGIGACWSADVEVNNNIVINSGLGPISESNNGTSPYGIHLGGDISGSILATNNLVWNVSDESSRQYADAAAIVIDKSSQTQSVQISLNIVDIPEDNFKISFIKASDSNIDISNNVFSRSDIDLSKNLQAYFPPFFVKANNFIINPAVKATDKQINYVVPVDDLPSNLLKFEAYKTSPYYMDFYGRSSSDNYIGPINIKSSSSSLISPPVAPELFIVE
jgi:hypothetical protein